MLLSNFLELMGLDLSYKYYYEVTKSRGLVSNKLDRSFPMFNPNVLLEEHVDNINVDNYVLKQYLDIYKVLNILNRFKSTKDDIGKLDRELKLIEVEIKHLNSKLEEYPIDKSNKLKSLGYETSKNLSSFSSKHKMVVNIKIKSLRNDINQIDLDHKYTTRLIEKHFNRKNEIITLIEKLDYVLAKLGKEYHDLKSLNSLHKDAIVPKVMGNNSRSIEAVNNTSGLINTAGAPKILNNSNGIYGIKRSFSTLREVNKTQIKDGSNLFKIDSPVHDELYRTINTSIINDETQIKIEQFLLRQGKIIFDEKLNDISNVNYSKLNSPILNILKNSISEIDLLLNNKRKYFNECLWQKKVTSYDINVKILLNNLNNSTIRSYLLGRLLKIISNNGLVNNNTIHTNLAIDLSKDLVNNYIYNEFVAARRRSTNLVETNDPEGFSDFKSNDKFSSLMDDPFLLTLGVELFHILETCKLISTKIVQISLTDKNAT